MFGSESVRPRHSEERSQQKLDIHVHHGNKERKRKTKVLRGEHPFVVDGEDGGEEEPSVLNACFMSCECRAG